MNWKTPTYAEIKMDAEIGSYQTDDGFDNDPIVSRHPTHLEQDATAKEA